MCIRDRILLLKLIIKIKFKRMQKANKTDVAFMKLMEDSANQECVDCRMPLLPYIRQSNILYASINNGIFICPKCSELHAPLGEDVSRIVTVSLGHIDEKEIKYFKIGGNKSFMEFMEKYELNGAATEMKYKSKAANYYRARLQKKVERAGISSSAPKPEEGKDVMQENSYLIEEQKQSVSRYVMAKVHTIEDSAKDAGSYLLDKGKYVGSAIASTWRKMFKRSRTEAEKDSAREELAKTE
eukprot:TRINITY_DN3208_c0_g3_i1.p1 TRINITY_DN3208_c0_g3~~TRINITY_DN3208_c0_g3_i1.p1  ORF type:complete len:241 (-),score=55.85 TRINITY_DN3208_c0_g3_i1:84-806(-)